MIAIWLGGFIAGTLLGKLAGFPYLQNWGPLPAAGIILLPTVMILTRRRNRTLFFLCSFSWGLLHAAPDYAGPCREFRTVRGNLLQNARGPAIVKIDGEYFETVKRAEASAVGGRPVSAGLIGPRIIPTVCGSSSFRNEKLHPHSAFALDRYLRRGGNPTLVGWLEAAVFGSRSELSFQRQKDFRTVGLIHLLVVSGLHVGLFALFCRAMLLLPILPFYALTIISATRWRQIQYVSELISLPLVCSYVWLIDAPSAAQRAATFYVLWVLCKLFFGVRRPLARCSVCLIAQTILFPIGFLNAGNMMSWIVTLLLVARLKDGDGWRADLLAVFDVRLQFKIMLVAGSLFAELTPLSLPANLLLAPVFGVILQISYLNLIFPHPVLSMINHQIVHVWLVMVEILAQFPVNPGWSWLGQRSIDPHTRIFVLGVTGILILNSLRVLTIRLPDDNAGPTASRRSA